MDAPNLVWFAGVRIKGEYRSVSPIGHWQCHVSEESAIQTRVEWSRLPYYEAWSVAPYALSLEVALERAKGEGAIQLVVTDFGKVVEVFELGK